MTELTISLNLHRLDDNGQAEAWVYVNGHEVGRVRYDPDDQTRLKAYIEGLKAGLRARVRRDSEPVVVFT